MKTPQSNIITKTRRYILKCMIDPSPKPPSFIISFLALPTESSHRQGRKKYISYRHKRKKLVGKKKLAIKAPWKQRNVF